MKFEVLRNVLPGDAITEKGNKCIGIWNNQALVPGQLCRLEDDLLFIRSKTSCYTPRVHDIVVGRILHVSADFYKVDLEGRMATLPALAFPNATKKNRPFLARDDLVLARISRTAGDLFLACDSPGLGKIDEAHPIEPWKVRLLYFSPLLGELGGRMDFQVALAINGFVWLDGAPRVKQRVLRELRGFSGMC